MSLWCRSRDSGTRTTELPTARCDPRQILAHSDDNLGRQAVRQPGRCEENSSKLVELISEETNAELEELRKFINRFLLDYFDLVKRHLIG